MILQKPLGDITDEMSIFKICGINRYYFTQLVMTHCSFIVQNLSWADFDILSCGEKKKKKKNRIETRRTKGRGAEKSEGLASTDEYFITYQNHIIYH